jgi:hypothetical protein
LGKVEAKPGHKLHDYLLIENQPVALTRCWVGGAIVESRVLLRLTSFDFLYQVL